SVLGRCDIEDEFPVVHKPFVDLIEQSFKADPLGQMHFRAQPKEWHSVSNYGSDLIGDPLGLSNVNESQVNEPCSRSAELSEFLHDLFRGTPDLDHVH